MQSSDDTSQATPPTGREPRPFNRRDYASERRQSILQQKHTDSLPIPGSQNGTINGKIAWRQFMQMREETKRLRWELSAYTREFETVDSEHQQELEQYQNQLDEMIVERDRTRQEYRQLERRYQELYHSFQSSVEEEAHNMVEQAARTLELTPQNRLRPANDALKTVELHVRQIEDQHTAELLYLLRQAQKKAKQLEQELAQEREQIAAERENLYRLQVSAREQADLRKHIVEDRLRLQNTLATTLITSIFIILLLILQIVFLNMFQFPLTPTLMISLVVPIILCIVSATVVSHIRSRARAILTSAPQVVAEKK